MRVDAASCRTFIHPPFLLGGGGLSVTPSAGRRPSRQRIPGLGRERRLGSRSPSNTNTTSQGPWGAGGRSPVPTVPALAQPPPPRRAAPIADRLPHRLDRSTAHDPNATICDFHNDGPTPSEEANRRIFIDSYFNVSYILPKG